MREVKSVIETESPDIHWGFLPIKDEVILDLGCGINNNEFIPTPVYWIKNGAKKVYGTDPSEQSYEWFKKNFHIPDFIYMMDYVDRTEKFELYINATKPSVVKIDVEGSEVFLNAVNPNILDGVNHFGIEYHNTSCLISCEQLLKSCGYNIEYYKLFDRHINYQGVLHAWK